MNDKTYLVLTPEKIEDIFRDLRKEVIYTLPWVSHSFSEKSDITITKAIESKKQELLKSIK